MRRILLALMLVSSFVTSHAENYTLGSDSQPDDGVPKGTVTKGARVANCASQVKQE